MNHVKKNFNDINWGTDPNNQFSSGLFPFPHKPCLCRQAELVWRGEERVEYLTYLRQHLSEQLRSSQEQLKNPGSTGRSLWPPKNQLFSLRDALLPILMRCRNQDQCFTHSAEKSHPRHFGPRGVKGLLWIGTLTPLDTEYPLMLSFT